MLHMTLANRIALILMFFFVQENTLFGRGEVAPAPSDVNCSEAHEPAGSLGGNLPGIRKRIPYSLTLMGGGNPEKVAASKAADRIRNVRYFDESQRQKFRASFKNGLAYDAEGKLLGRSIFGKTPTEYLYVMDADGTFYIGHENEVIHHSSFLATGPVAAAGLIRILNGKITFLSNESGHYQPTEEFFNQAVCELGLAGISGYEKKIKPPIPTKKITTVEPIH